MKNHDAYALAEVMVSVLMNWCEKIEIVGSIRRGRPEVNDIDLVLLPKPGQIPAIKARIQRRCRVVTDGPDSIMAELALPLTWRQRLGLESVHLDFLFANHDERQLLYTVPSNWGTLVVCRTGSKEHNIRLCERAKSMGLHWNPHRGVMKGEAILAARTEEDVFKALDLPLIPSAFREGDVCWSRFMVERPAPVPQKPVQRVDEKTAARLFGQMRQRLERVAAGAVADGYSEATARAAVAEVEASHEQATVGGGVSEGAGSDASAPDRTGEGSEARQDLSGRTGGNSETPSAG